MRNITERYDGYGEQYPPGHGAERTGSGQSSGVVADLIQVDKDYEVAIETALGGSIQNIVTDNESDCEDTDRISEEKPVRPCYVFPPMSSISPRGDFSPQGGAEGAGSDRSWPVNW